MALMTWDFLSVAHHIDPSSIPGMTWDAYRDIGFLSNQGPGKRRARRILRRAFQRKRARYLTDTGLRLWRRHWMFMLVPDGNRPDTSGWTQV